MIDKLKKRVALIGCALLAIALPWTLSLQAEEGSRSVNPLQMNNTTLAAGKQVFFEYCAGCHGRRADGRGQQSLNLVPKPQNLRNAQFVKYLTDERLYSSISGGVRGTSMPAFELMISSEQRWQVITYIRSLTAHDEIDLPNSVAHQPVASDAKNPVPISESSVARGKHLFLNYCSNCHGAKADGKGVIAENLVPEPRNLIVVASWGEKPFIDYMSDARLYDSITNGVPGTSMLPWIKVFSDDDRWHIINFLRSQADLEREKGARIFQ